MTDHAAPDPAPATPTPLPTDRLRWRCPDAWIDFETTATVDPLRGIRGQPTAMDALRFGLATRAPGHHVFVRGLAGTGRATMIGEVLDELKPACDRVADHCCVHNFEDPSRPRILTVPSGRGREFARRIDELAMYVTRDLPNALASETVTARQAAIVRDGQARLDALLAPIEKEVAEAGAALVTVGDGPGSHPAVFPIIDGEPAPPEALRRLRAEGTLSEADFEATTKRLDELSERLERTLPDLQTVQESVHAELRTRREAEIRRLMQPQADRVARHFPDDAVAEHLKAFVDAVVEHGPPNRDESEGERSDSEPPAVLRVNVLRHSEKANHCPVVVETSPSRANLFGTIEITPNTPAPPHMAVRAGSLIEAGGGYLVMEARDLLVEPGAWMVLARTLRSNTLEIEPVGEGGPRGIKPDPIPISAKVVLVGDAEVFAALDQADPDFPHLFKVVADFDSSIPREPEAAAVYAGVLARLATEESLPPFAGPAVRRLLEHGARIAASSGRVTARLGRVCDLAREAAFLAQTDGDAAVDDDHIRRAIVRGRQRAELPSRRFREFLTDGTIVMETSGRTIGQINGLATMSVGPLTYGFPQRITASVGPGTLGLVNVEYEAELSGAIHTKGFHILRGLLHHLLQLEHPIALDASIVFEQSYGGVDGDSASGAEACCLLSALTGTPLRQDVAMTGAIDQRGSIMAVGAVNEKVDGFYDACVARGLAGTEAVIIPASNADDLSLREDVVAACDEGRFRVHPVARVEEALAILIGQDVPIVGNDRREPEGILAIARAEAERLWRASQEGATTTARAVQVAQRGG